MEMDRLFGGTVKGGTWNGGTGWNSNSEIPPYVKKKNLRRELFLNLTCSLNLSMVFLRIARLMWGNI